MQFVYCSVDKNKYANCKPHLFLTNGKEVLKLTSKQIEDVMIIGFEGLFKIIKPLVYIVILTRTYTQTANFINFSPTCRGFTVILLKTFISNTNSYLIPSLQRCLKFGQAQFINLKKNKITELSKHAFLLSNV